jgi:4-hydroxybenzoate polyprenyltransferase
VIETVADEVAGVRRRAASSWSLARALRVRQWPKNLLLFAGLLFAAKLGDASRWGEAWLAFAVYCAGSSAAYLVNDVRDAGRDRLHPTKRHRPVASRRLSVGVALAISAALAAAGLAGAAGLGIESLGFFVGFLVLQVAYSFRLKQVVGLDVLTIAALFTIRAAAGAEAVHVRVSPWLLACTALLALFLGLAKRRGELGLDESDGSLRRPVLAHYSVGVLDRLLVGVAAATVGAYTAYTLSARSSLEMVVTVPFVVLAIGRYLVLVHRHGLGEEPEEVLLRDVPILVVLAAWAVTAALVLTLS